MIFDSCLLFWATVYASRIQTAVYKIKIRGSFSEYVFEKYIISTFQVNMHLFSLLHFQIVASFSATPIMCFSNNIRLRWRSSRYTNDDNWAEVQARFAKKRHFIFIVDYLISWIAYTCDGWLEDEDIAGGSSGKIEHNVSTVSFQQPTYQRTPRTQTAASWQDRLSVQPQKTSS